MTRKNDFISLGFCLALSAFMLAPLLTTATIHSFPANALPQEDAVKTEAKERVQKMYKDLDMSREQYNSAWDVVYDYVDRFMDIKQQAAEGGDKEAVYERFKKAKKDYKAEMKEVLDEEQYQQFAEGKWGTNDKEAIDRALE